jgi:hypothetical protein
MILDKKYFINVGAKGKFTESGAVSSTPEDVDNIFQYLDNSDIERLLVYFHGGLVSEKNGMDAAEVMRAHFANEEKKMHVVSFVWETGPIETIMQNLDKLKKLAEESLFEEVVKFVIKIAARKIGIANARGGGGVYLTDETIADEKQKEAPFEDLDRELNARGGPGIDIANEDEDSSEFFAELRTESRNLINAEGSEEIKYTPDDNADVPRGGLFAIAKVVAQIAFAVLKRYVKKTDHDFYPTIMEEAFRKICLDKIGNWGWSQMKDKSADMFKSNTDLSGTDLYAGTYFLHHLQKHIDKRIAAGKEIHVDLIGHSAGSIAICNLLLASLNDFGTIKYNNVFFLAPACRTDLFLSTNKKAQENNLYKKFKMFTMQEVYEKKDHCIPVIYTHSLLYLISGILEDDIDAKIMGLHEQFKAEGRYADFDELRQLKAFIDNNKLVLSSDTGNADDSMRSNSFKHGDFDNDDFTLISILKSL